MRHTTRLAKVAVLLFATLMAVCALADPNKITVDFGAEGDHSAYFQKKDKLQQLPSDATKVSGKSVDLSTSLDPATDGKDVVLVITDNAKGSAMIKPLEDAIAAKIIKVKDTDLNLVSESLFSIHGPSGGLVASGMLHIEAKDDKQDIPFSPSDKGVVSYRLHAPGDLKVSLDYRSNGQSKTLPAQTFDSKLGVKPVETVLTITDPVDLIQPPAETKTDAKSDSGKADKKKSSDSDDEDTKAGKASKDASNTVGSVIGSFLSLIFGLIVVGGIGYGLWWYYKNNTKTVQTVLSQAGVPIAQDADPTGVAPIAQAAPQPMQKIVLDPNAQVQVNTTPFQGNAGIAQGAAPMASPTASAVKNPRLVGDDGMVFMLTDGSHNVSRELGSTVSLVGQSSVSRNHATLTASGGIVSVSDTGSTNGTFVNGVKIMAPTQLQPGDIVQFGAIRTRYEE